MKKKILLVAALVTFVISGCGSKQEPSTDKMTNSVTEETQESVSEEIEAEQPVEEEPEKVEAPDSLEEYLSAYQDSATYHLLYDYALNDNADGTNADGINYMFMNDDDGNRIVGSVMAFYTSPKVENKDDSESYVNSFEEYYFPELVPISDMAQDTAAEDHWIRSYYFDDYVISFIPESDLDGVTVALSKVNN